MRTAIVPATALEQWARGNQILGIAQYGAVDVANIPRGVPVARVATEQLGGVPLVEVWLSALPVEQFRHGPIQCSSNGRALFGVLSIEEADGCELSVLAEGAYASLLGVAHDAGYDQLLRVWNYLPNINEDHGGLERYRHFCVGRHTALQKHCAVMLGSPPAASALGTRSREVVIYFVATKGTVTRVENPRQVSAYRYPAQYGPKSPSFSRAAHTHWGREQALYISGTASIVGHETLHPGDPDAQLDETLRNIEAVTREASRLGWPGGQLAPDLLKVYIRRRDDCARIRARLERAVGVEVPALYLEADLCRRDLLLEIDAFCFARDAARSELGASSHRALKHSTPR